MIFDVAEAWKFNLQAFDSVWAFLIQVLLLLAALLIANTLRRTIPLLRKAFVPSALIGGLILFLINILFEYVFHINLAEKGLVDKRVMQIITYHALAIGFIASTLKFAVNKGERVPFLKSIQNGAITGGTYMLQAVLGIAVSLIIFAIGGKLFYDAGILLPLGFGQGPGNALAWDINFTNMEDSGFTGHGSVGLTIASIGFLVASIVGVIYMNIYRHKGQIIHKDVTLRRKVDDFEVRNEIEDSDSVDKFSVQIAFVAVCYGLAFLIMVFFSKLTDWTGVALFDSVAWGFNFIWGVIAANLMKIFLNSLRKAKMMKKKYINNYQMDRISGFAFDLMIIAGVAAIDVEKVGEYIWFIVILCVVGTLATIFYVRFMTKMCFKEYQHEAFLVNFGTLTGTASNGMIFLREIDPANDTPMSSIFIVSQLPAMLFVAPLLLLLNMSASSQVKCYIALGVFAGLFLIYTAFLILSAKGVFNKKPKENVEKAE